MGVAFGLLVLGLILHAVFVGEMLAHGMVGPLVILAQWLVGGQSGRLQLPDRAGQVQHPQAEREHQTNGVQLRRPPHRAEP